MFNEYIRWNYGFRNVIFIDEPRGSDFSVMVWGSICYSETIYLETADGRLNGESYLDILGRFTEEVDESFNRTQSWKFQQDGAPAHRPNKVKDFLKDNGFSIHAHPPNSPDLNPIETIWDWMKQNVEKRRPDTV